MSDKLIGTSLGLAFVAVGGFYFLLWQYRRRNWVKTTGVVKTVQDGMMDGWQTFEYEANGIFYNKAASTNSNPAHIGRKKVVYYNPKNPKNADIDSPTHYYLFAYLMPIVGAAFAFAAYTGQLGS